ncbi:MAG: capsule biosynthesis protein [Tsuneonella suprasediminis]
MTARSFLFLQGPPGPFYSQLATGLRASGHRCHRINLNGGDWLDWRGHADNFTGQLAGWSAYLHDFATRHEVSDIILFGDCRPHHVAARAYAATQDIVVHVFEEGYIRPDWVTLERGGVNGNSSLPRDPEAYLSLASGLPPVPTYRPVPSSFLRRAREACAYFLSAWLLTPVFRGYRSHRPYPVRNEFGGWLRRMVCRPLARARSMRTLKQIAGRPFFLLPLQLDSDHQIRTHSPFSGMRDAIAGILASFAAHAPAECLLLVKEHPLDNGLHGWRRTVMELAGSLGIARRVRFIEHGDLYSIVAAATGVVTVNSTTGTLALASHIPVIVLGQAVYDLPGVTHQEGLDAFWSVPTPPQLEIYAAFRRVLVARSLLRGGFSSVEGRKLLVPAAVERLRAACDRMPVTEEEKARA